MAKRKAKRTVRRRRAAPKRTVRRRSSSKMDYLSPLIYGAVRGKVYSMVAPYAMQLPGGELSDEVGMIAFNYLLPKAIKNTTVRKVAKVGLTVELAAVGNALSRGYLPGRQPSGQSITGAYMYG